MLRDVTSDQQNGGTTATLVIDRDAAARFGIQPQVIDDTLYDAFGQRQITQYFSQVNSYHLILEVPPAMAGDPATLDKLYVHSSTGQAVPLSTFVHWSTLPVQPLSISHQSQFPAVTISFNLAPGAALGQAVDAIQATVRQMGVPITVAGSFQGTAQAFQSSLATQPYLIAAALISVYIILGILYESYILPLTILSTRVLGRCRRAADAAAVPLRPVGDRDDRRDPADRHREEERHHDGGLRHHRRAARRR